MQDNEWPPLPQITAGAADLALAAIGRRADRIEQDHRDIAQGITDLDADADELTQEMAALRTTVAALRGQISGFTRGYNQTRDG